LVWALAAASAVFWGFRVLVKSPPAPPHTQTAEPTRVASGDLTRLLGADPPPPAASEAPEPAAAARFQLIGVVTPRASQAAREGLALIAVDGKPARAYRVGAVVDGQTVLQSVAARGATLGPRGGAALVALNLAPPAAAATGVLPAAGAVTQGSPAVPTATMPRTTMSAPPGYVPPPPSPRRTRTRQPDAAESEPAAAAPPDGTLTR